ncbi:MAG: sodium:proton exchanger [Bacteroidales bacterium 36-12]|nr:MAG: sodium:proton exchanger [Bacteroidales bacterium 36-12]
MILQILILIAGFIALIKGAAWLVDGSTALAKKYRVSDLVIGLTIVAFGTSMPELVVNAFAAYENRPEIVFGNIIGSNNLNLFIILGVSGLIAPLVVKKSTVKFEIPFSLIAVLVLLILSNYSIFSSGKILSRFDGVILLLCFAGFLYYIFRQMQQSKTDYFPVDAKPLSNWKIWSFIVLGLTLLVVGGKLVVNSAVEIATFLGVSQAVIGLTIVAAGTSLPELATSIVATLKKNNDIAIGNVIGSNIFNIFLILGISSVIRPIPFNVKFNFDIFLLIFGTLLLIIAMFVGKKSQLSRWQAGILFTIYLGYMISLFIQ